MNKYKFVFGLLFVLLFTPLVSSATGPYNEEDVDSDPSSTCVSLSYNMRYRSKDSSTNGEVSDLQDFLQAKGYLNSEPTGYFGLLTKKAVQSFQKANNIFDDGYVNSFTRTTIKSISCGGGSVVAPVGLGLPYFIGGCNSYDGYSSTTGEKCRTQNINYPVGCNSSSRYSSVTGEACGETTSSISITISSPYSPAKVGNPYRGMLGVSDRYNRFNGVSTNLFNWSLSSGSLPPGLYLTHSDYGQIINGTPTVAGTYNFSLTVTTKSLSQTDGDPKPPFLTSTRNFTLVVDPAVNNFPPGCLSNSGFSSTTGLACDGSGGASDIIMSFSSVPSIIDVGKSSKISWTSKNAKFCNLTYPGDPSGLFNLNDSINVSPQKTTTYTLYCSDNYGRSQNQSITVNVNPVTDSTPKIYSLTNAYVPIGGDSSHARVNDKIYVFGANFNSNADVIIDSFDGSQYTRRPTTFINSEQLSFIVPSHIKIGSHSISIQVNTQADPPSLLSNAVSLSVVASFYHGCSSSAGYSSVDGKSCNQG